MRISSSTLYDRGVASMQQSTFDLVKSQLQIAAGRRILSPADDPVGSARVLEMTQSQTLNLQYDVNINSAASSLGMEDSILGSVAELLVTVRTEAILAEDSSLSTQARTNIATGLSGRFQELMGLANSTDGNGQYLFSGYKNVTPFTGSSPGPVTYNGDQGQRLVQVSPSRQMAVSDSGADVFRPLSIKATSPDIFKTLGDLIIKLSAGTATDVTDIQKLDQALQNVLTVRTSVGTRMQELDSLKVTGTDLQLQYTQTISNLQDLDYTKAATDLARQKAALEAAQLSFMKIQNLSLFNYIS